MVYQQGGWGSQFTSRWAGMAAYNDDGTPIEGGMVLPNPVWLYPHSGYKADSLWDKMQSLVGYETYTGPPAFEDLNSILVFKRGYTVVPAESLRVLVIIAARAAGSTQYSHIITLLSFLTVPASVVMQISMGQ
jgi:hypothetical protein